MSEFAHMPASRREFLAGVAIAAGAVAIPALRGLTDERDDPARSDDRTAQQQPARKWVFASDPRSALPGFEVLPG